MSKLLLSKLLKEKCQELELSSRQVAKGIGVSHTTILRALRGDIIDLETLIGLADWLRVKPSVLLNSRSSSDDALADKVTLVLERHPKLKDVFSKALDTIVNKDVELALIDDIVLYANYKLNIYSK